MSELGLGRSLLPGTEPVPREERVPSLWAYYSSKTEEGFHDQYLLPNLPTSYFTSPDAMRMSIERPRGNGTNFSGKKPPGINC